MGIGVRDLDGQHDDDKGRPYPVFEAAPVVNQIPVRIVAHSDIDPGDLLSRILPTAASDSHASGSLGEDKNYHRFHRMRGGFLEVETERKGREACLHFRLRDIMRAPICAHTFTRPVTA